MKRAIVLGLVIIFLGAPAWAGTFIQVQESDTGFTLKRVSGNKVIYGTTADRESVRTFYSKGKNTVWVCTWASHREVFSHFKIYTDTITEGGDPIPEGKCS